MWLEVQPDASGETQILNLERVPAHHARGR